MARTLTEEHKRKISEAKKGHKHTEEAKELIRQAKTGVKRDPFTEEWKAKLSASATKRWEKYRETKATRDAN